MSNDHPLDSVIYISFPVDFAKKSGITVPDAFDPTIVLPVQCASPVDKEKFDISCLTWEMILAGMLTHLAYPDVNTEQNPKINDYYRSILFSFRPEIKRELAETAILSARNEEYDIAEEIFDALRGLDPLDTAIQLNTALFFDQRADSYRRSGLIEDADAYDASAEQYYTKLLGAEPAIPDAFFNAGFFYMKQRSFLRARSCFETYLNIALGDSDNDMYKKQRAQEILTDIVTRDLDNEIFKSAYDLISDGEEETGLEKIRLFLETHPKVWNAWFLLGWALRRLERWEDAKAAFLQAILLGAEQTDVYNELALCLMELGEFAESKKHLVRALTLEPENTKVMSNLGFLSLRMGNTEEGRRYFLSVLEFDPQDVIAKQALGNLDC